MKDLCFCVVSYSPIGTLFTKHNQWYFKLFGVRAICFPAGPTDQALSRSKQAHVRIAHWVQRIEIATTLLSPAMFFILLWILIRLQPTIDH